MNKRVSLYLAQKDVPTTIDVVQGTTAPAITFILEDFEPHPGAQAQIFIKKENSEVYNSCTLSGNEVTFTPTTGSFDEVGYCVAQLEITSGDTIAASYRIWVKVEPNIIDGDAIEASDDFSALQQAIAAVGDITEYKAQTDENTTNIELLDQTALAHTNQLESLDERVTENTGDIAEMKPITDKFNIPKINEVVTTMQGGNNKLLIGSEGMTLQNSSGNPVWNYTPPVVIYGTGGNVLPDVALDNNTWTQLASVDLTEPGIYILEFFARYNANPTGVRALNLSDTSGSSSAYSVKFFEAKNACSTGTTPIRMVTLLSSATGNVTYFINGWQSSGGALGCKPRISMVRLTGPAIEY